jgi:hypothetical protein
MNLIRFAFFALLLTAFAVSASGVYAHLGRVHSLRGAERIPALDRGALERDAAEHDALKKEWPRPRVTPEQRIASQLDWMKKELRLNEQQVAKIKTILLEKRKMMIDRQSLKLASPGRKKAAVEQLLQQRRVTHERIIAVLSAGQRTKYESMLGAEGKAVHGSHPKHMKH